MGLDSTSALDQKGLEPVQTVVEKIKCRLRSQYCKEHETKVGKIEQLYFIERQQISPKSA